MVTKHDRHGFPYPLFRYPLLFLRHITCNHPVSTFPIDLIAQIPRRLARDAIDGGRALLAILQAPKRDRRSPLPVLPSSAPGPGWVRVVRPFDGRVGYLPESATRAI